MKQSRLASLLESIGGTVVGFLIALAVQMFLVPLVLGFKPSTEQDLVIVGIFTVASIIRGYLWRRVMEALHVRHPMSPAALAVIAERHRQQHGEGWTPEHDDKVHARGELALAGVCYVLSAVWPGRWAVNNPPPQWPWDGEWWKPQGFWRDIVRGAALILAEMDRAVRNRRKPEPRPSVLQGELPLAHGKSRSEQGGAPA